MMSLLLRFGKPLLMASIALTTNCVAQTNCSVSGAWRLSKGLLTRNYEGSRPYSSNRLIFYKDSVELASGFFYSLEGVFDDHVPGRFPFVYYGNLEKYKIVNDSVKVYSGPYKTWSTYKIVCNGLEQVSLLGRQDTLILNRPIQEKMNENVGKKIKYIKAHIDDGNTIVSLYKLNYKVTYTDDDSLVYEEWNVRDGIFEKKNYKLRNGAFEKICAGFDYLNPYKLKRVYKNEWSDFIFMHVEIGFANGKSVKTTIQGNVGPDELRIALVPVFYGHQQILYGHLPPKSWDEF